MITANFFNSLVRIGLLESKSIKDYLPISMKEYIEAYESIGNRDRYQDYQLGNVLSYVGPYFTVTLGTKND